MIDAALVTPPEPEPQPPSLPEVNLFRGFEPAEIKLFLDQVRTCVLKDGDTVFQAGEASRVLYILAQGSVRIELPDVEGDEGVISTLTPVAVFGESNFFHAHPHGTTARCVGQVELLCLDRAVYDAWLAAASPLAGKLAVNAAELLAGRLQQTDQWIQRTLSDRETQRQHTSWREFRQHMTNRIPGTGRFMSAGGV